MVHFYPAIGDAMRSRIVLIIQVDFAEEREREISDTVPVRSFHWPMIGLIIFFRCFDTPCVSRSLCSIRHHFHHDNRFGAAGQLCQDS